MSKSYKHKLRKVNKFEDDEVDCIVWASGQPLRSLAKYLFKQKKDDPLEKVASPPPQLWGELDSPINNQGGYSCDIVSLASCTIFFSHYAYSIAILHFSVLQAESVILRELDWQCEIQWIHWIDIFPIKHIPIQTPLSISGSSRTLVALDLELSAFCLVAYKASTERLHPSLFAATILASYNDLHLLSYLSFSINLLHGGSGSSSPYFAFRCPGKGYATIIVVVFS